MRLVIKWYDLPIQTQFSGIKIATVYGQSAFQVEWPKATLKLVIAQDAKSCLKYQKLPSNLWKTLRDMDMQNVVWNHCSLFSLVFRRLHVTLTVTLARLLALRSSPWIFEEKRDCSRRLNPRVFTLRWFLSIALRIPIAHDFCVTSTRTWVCGCTFSSPEAALLSVSTKNRDLLTLRYYLNFCRYYVNSVAVIVSGLSGVHINYVFWIVSLVFYR